MLLLLRLFGKCGHTMLYEQAEVLGLSVDLASRVETDAMVD